MDWSTIAISGAAVVVAALNAFTAFLAYRTRVDMKTLEHNTNSIMEKLVTSEKKASRAQGRREGEESKAKR